MFTAFPQKANTNALKDIFPVIQNRVNSHYISEYTRTIAQGQQKMRIYHLWGNKIKKGSKYSINIWTSARGLQVLMYIHAMKFFL